MASRGSSALTIALIYGLKKLQIKNNLNIYNIIDRAFFAERIKYKVHGGWQDFFMAQHLEVLNG